MNSETYNNKTPKWDVLNGIHLANNCGGNIYLSPHCMCHKCTGRRYENDGIKRFYIIQCDKCDFMMGGIENVNHRLTFNIQDLKY